MELKSRCLLIVQEQPRRAFRQARQGECRAIAVGCNDYGIETRRAADRRAVPTFVLVFDVVYTLWWGYAIFFMFDGLGLEMKSGRKKEK